MNTNTSDTEKSTTPELGAAQAKGKRTPAKKAKAKNKPPRAKKVADKPKSDRANKKAEVIALMKRAKGATLAEIMAATKIGPGTSSAKACLGFSARLGRWSSSSCYG
jgi:hypothetical protein